MKTKLTLFAFGLFIIQGTTAQTLKPDIISTAGDYYKNSSGSLSWTIGEPITELFSTANNKLTQGFQQSSITVTAIEEKSNPESNISVYPNPAISTINIKSDQTGVLNVELTDLTGKLILKKTFSDNNGQIDLSSYSGSFYFLKVYNTENQILKTYKIQKVN